MQSISVSLSQNLIGWVLNAASSFCAGHGASLNLRLHSFKFPSCIISCAALRKPREGRMQEGRSLQPSNWGPWNAGQLILGQQPSQPAALPGNATRLCRVGAQHLAEYPCEYASLPAMALPSQDPLAALLCILATHQPPLSTRSSEERLSMIVGFHLWTYHCRAKEASKS